ncbi:MAG: hypothetical protein HYY91_04175 [Candidatus Omnitrophica bacterium]|nr:hypothetical protein [Candidatus Omnitrophota bacterium]
MTRSLPDPYQAVLRRFNRLGVRYVVVGMAGINYYAANPAETFATLDYDLFLEPTLENVGRAVRGLTTLGFTLGTAEGRLDPRRLRIVVRDQRTLVATTPDGLSVELLLRVSGYPFSELAKDARTFSVRGVPVRVGRLAKLLRSKQLAGRPKDRAFLKRYQLLLEKDIEG